MLHGYWVNRTQGCCSKRGVNCLGRLSHIWLAAEDRSDGVVGVVRGLTKLTYSQLLYLIESTFNGDFLFAVPY